MATTTTTTTTTTPTKIKKPRKTYTRKPKKIEIAGVGIVDNIKAVVYGRKDLPPKVRDIMDKMGSKEITKIQIGRTPLPSLTSTFVNIITLGAFKKVMKEKPFDDLYHLFLLLTFSDGDRLLVEKNQVINMEINPVIPSKTTMIDSSTPTTNTTLDVFIDNTRNLMGWDQLSRF